MYDGILLATSLRLDLLVEEAAIVEVKAVDVLAPIDDAPMLTYLGLTGKRLGLLMNFNCMHLRDGIRRKVM